MSGFGFYPLEILQAPRLGHHLKALPLHLVDILWSVSFPGHDSLDLHLASVQPAKIAVVGTSSIVH